MSNCELRIELDRQDRNYPAGSQVRGQVKVTPEKSITCKALTIEQAWGTHGRGNSETAVLASSVERDLAWEAGQTYTYPFAFLVPLRPLSYHGELLNIDHYVRARAKLSWASDPQAEEDYVVVTGAGSREAYLSEPLETMAPAASSGCFTRVLTVIFFPMLVILVLMAAVFILPFILLFFLIKYFLRRLAEGKLGKVKVAIDAPTAVTQKDKTTGPVTWARQLAPGQGKPEHQTYAISPGQSFGLGLEFRPRNEVSVTRLTAVLQGRERCRSGHGSSAKTYTHELCRRETVLAEGVGFRVGELAQLVAEIPVPDLQACSFEASDNHLEWELTVCFDIPDWPDWKQVYKLRMTPE